MIGSAKAARSYGFTQGSTLPQPPSASSMAHNAALLASRRRLLTLEAGGWGLEVGVR